MGLCYPGTFKMGYPEDYSNPETEIEIEHAFLLGATTVTQELYNAVMKTNPSYYKGGWGGLPADADMSKHPIENMSIYEAIEFCNKLSKLQGLDPFYTLKSYPDANKFPKRQEIGIVSNSKGYRLPEEKEWGYAAKAGTENRWAGTDDESKLEEYAWFGGNSFAIESSAQLVATKKPNEWGFYDMSGNVQEWCWDTYAPHPTELSDTNRFFCGGSWFSDALSLHSARRVSGSPDYSRNYIGFRVARSIVN